jgi:hypothetical protein
MIGNVGCWGAMSQANIVPLAFTDDSKEAAIKGLFDK